MELESPFADKLHTNYAPSEPEIRLLHTLVREAETEQSRLQAILDGFLYQKAKIDEHIRTHRALLAGIRQLPTELLQKIFVYCLPSEGNTNVSAKEAPLLLGRVCRAWRQLSLSVPDLWSSLRICPPLPNLPTAHQMYGDGILAWLNRSGVLPLSVSFIERDPYVSRPRVNAIPHKLPRPTIVLDTMMQFSRRWRSVEIELFHPQSLARLALLNPDDVLMLEEVKIEPPWRCGWDSLEATFLEGMLSPSSIRKVSFLGYIAMPPVSMLPPHWKNLTELRMDSRRNRDDATLTPATALKILSHCRNIVVCTFSLRSHAVEPPMNPGSLVLPCLERLEIRYHWTTTTPILDIFLFFGTLDPPALRCLMVKGTYNLRLPFISLLKRSHLDDLRISTVPQVREDALIECLNFAPSLTRLHIFAEKDNTSSPLFQLNPNIHTLPDRTNLITRLTPSVTGQCLCPQLGDIQISRIGYIKDTAVLGLISSRARSENPGIGRLRCVSFDIHGECGYNVFDDLQSFIVDGLDVQLEYPPPQPYFDPDDLPRILPMPN